MTNPNPSPELHEAAYLIRKSGYFYRPNAQGYTTSKAEAGRYTLAEAWSHSHPNGPTGPRDGMDYILADEPVAPKCPACDGTKVVSQGGHDTGCNACYVDARAVPAPSLSTDVQSAATGFHEHDISLKVAMPGEVEGAKYALLPIEPTEDLLNAIACCGPDISDPPTIKNAYYTLWLQAYQSTRTLATVAAGDDEGVATPAANTLEYRTDYQIGKADGVEAAAKVADAYLTGEADADHQKHGRTLAAAIRLLSQGEGK
jgi:hypothetical protein